MSTFELPWAEGIEPILQSEAAECGLACVAMVANYHGHKLDLPGLRRRIGSSLKGATLADLMRNASELDLAPRPLRLDMHELGELRLPAILHWEMNHFVVLERVGASEATILDPARGRRKVPLADVSRSFTGVALELEPSVGFASIDARARPRIRDLWSGIARFRVAMTQVIGLALLLQITALLLPFFVQLTLDEAIGQGDRNLMLLLAVGFGTIYLLNALLQALRAWVVLTLGESIAYQLAGNVVRHLIRLPTAYFERRHVGDIVSRVGSIRPIQDMLTQGFVNMAVDGVLALTMLIVMMLISIPITLIVAAATLIYLGLALLMFPEWRRRTEEEIVARAGEETYLLETIRGARTIKLNGSEALREAGWRNRFADIVSANYRASLSGIRLALVENVVFNGEFVLIVYIGAEAAISGRITIGQLLAFIAYRTSFMQSATQLVTQVRQWRMVGLHLDRLSDIVGERREEIGPVPPRALAGPPPAISVEGLSFAYAPGEPPILRDVSLEIPAGGFVAIVGASGAGKTTLMRLLLGLLTPDEGRILIDGVPLGSANLGAWRARAAAVLQDDVLLAGTYADNIAFFDAHLDMVRVEAAARFARIHDEIMAMPMGYQSLVGDMGAALSSGQRQRMLLARAVYRQPDALFLDEGTAHLDEALENAIGDAIGGLPATRIAIAHRPALIARADLVLEVAGGAVTIRKPGRRKAS